MSDPFPTLSYKQNNFPYAAANAVLRKRSIAWWLRIAPTVSTALIFLSLILSAGSSCEERPLILAVTASVFLLGLAIFLLAIVAGKRIGYKNLANSPHRSGLRNLKIESEGVTVTGPNSRSHYPWRDIFDVMEGPQGSALILLNPYEYEPVPTNAFADSAQQAKFITVLQAQLAAAKENP
ncbi:MAG: YcxB family protein [Pseudomonadota bacterium]